MTDDNTVPTSAGLSSFNLLEEEELFNGLDLQPGMQLLDFGCGVGNYAIAAAPYIGETGRVYAVDLWDEGVETLDVRINMASLNTVETSVCGAGDTLPIEARSIDMCLLATVVHILVQENVFNTALQEIERVLKPGARIAIVEFYKTEGPPGPPIEWRLSPEELQQIMVSSGYNVQKTLQVGPHNYLSLFRKDPAGEK